MMVKVSFKYNPEMVQWMKQTGGRWNPNERVWDVPDAVLDELRAKAEELGVELSIAGAAAPGKAPTKIPPGRQQTFEEGYGEGEEPSTPSKPYTAPYRGAGQEASSGAQVREGEIRLRRSRDGRFVLISMNLIAFSEDVRQLLAGEKDSVRFRVLPPRPRPQQNPNA